MGQSKQLIVSPEKIKQFQKMIWNYYKTRGRHDLPWRLTRDPYKILVSEIMLQQTQVSRVILKYKNFLKKFPSVQTLAKAKLSDVLKEWQGLGYNRRGLYLKKCAEEIVKKFNGKFPKDLKTLKSLPGIGPTTAADICAFAWNVSADGAGLPVISIETNIRTVFIDYFFGAEETCKTISDQEIFPFIKETLPEGKAREWYYALMDYGSFLKTNKIQKRNHNARSSHYVKQSKFEGSNRQKRSVLLKLILEKPRSEKELFTITQFDPEIISKNTNAMRKEGLIHKKGVKLYA